MKQFEIGVQDYENIHKDFPRISEPAEDSSFLSTLILMIICSSNKQYKNWIAVTEFGEKNLTMT